jgi:hypothetical protein
MGAREGGTLVDRRPPSVVRPLTEEERQAREQGLRSKDAFVLRRCQIRLASARGARAPRSAAYVGSDDQTVLDALHACNATGRACVRKTSSRAPRTRLVFGPDQAGRRRARVHRSPRAFGKPGSLWTLEWAAAVCVAAGRVAPRVSGEPIRQPLLRRGSGWERAKQWITRPAPGYARKQGGATA